MGGCGLYINILVYSSADADAFERPVAGFARENLRWGNSRRQAGSIPSGATMESPRSLRWWLMVVMVLRLEEKLTVQKQQYQFQWLVVHVGCHEFPGGGRLIGIIGHGRWYFLGNDGVGTIYLTGSERY